MSRLKRSRRARQQMDSQKIEETTEIDSDGSLHSAASDITDNESVGTPEISSAPAVEPEADDVPPSTTGNLTKCRCESKLTYRAALKGDWQAAEMLLGLNPNLAHDKISKAGDTALHVAAATKHKKFVQELVKKTTQGLSKQNDDGYTALYYAAASGIVDTASTMVGKDANLPNIRLDKKLLPFHMAVLFGNRDMVLYLQDYTKVEDLPNQELFELFLDVIRNRMYEVALKILENNAHLATMPHDEEGTALHLLAGHDISDISARKEAILERFVTMFAAVPCLSWVKRIFEQPLMRKKARLLAENLWTEIHRLEQEEMLKRINKPPILHDAAKAGNVQFITMLARAEPDLLWETKTDNKYTVFHIAVLERQESVFRLIRQIGAMKILIASLKDDKGNNILHLAGKLAPKNRLSIVSGAALQMQRELMWFKEMERILPPFCSKVKNKCGLRPRELFSEEHKDLLKDGETWMRDTADSCMLIATIMLTVAFTAGFTVPGGNNSDTGIPILLKRTCFKAFVASDAMAMFCSTFSIMMFLSILTSRFQEDDFLVSLPWKLVLGLAGLFGSLIGTILAFTSAYFLMFNVEIGSWLPVVLGSAPCVLLTIVFLFQHIKLFMDTISSTFWYTMGSTFGHGYLFRPSKHSLF